MESETRRTQPKMTGLRARIADAAIRVIARDGFDIVSIRTVAREAGVVHGTVQYHFATRDALLAGALLRFSQRQEARVDAALAAIPPAATPVERMVHALRELLPLDDRRREEAALWVAMSSAASTRPSLAEPYRNELALLRDAIRSALTDFRAAGLIAPAIAPDDGALLISAFINGLMIDGLNAKASDLPRLEPTLALGLRLILGVETRAT